MSCFPADIVRDMEKMKDILWTLGLTMHILFDVNSAFIHPMETWNSPCVEIHHVSILMEGKK